MNYQAPDGLVHLLHDLSAYNRTEFVIKLVCLMADDTTNTKGYYDITRKQLTRAAVTCIDCIAHR